MFSRFSGISAADYGRRTGQTPWVGQKPLGSVPGGPRPSLGSAQGTTTPLCLCNLQRKKDAQGKSPDNQARRSM